MIVALSGVCAAAAVAVAILDRPGRRRTLAMAAALLLTPIVIGADQWDSPQVAELRDSPALLAVTVVAVTALTVAGAALILRRPVLLPLLLVAALPFRVPLGVGGVTANLLVPLYVVVAAGVLAAIWREVRPATGSTAVPAGAGPPPVSEGRLARWFRPLLAVAVLAYAISILYSEDRSAGLLDLCFFLVPFGVVFALITEIEWSRRTIRLTTVVALGMAALCAVVGLIEWAVGSLLWNEAVIRSNDFHVYFRVNSLFWDPNVFGRYLALAITLAAAGLAWARHPRRILILVACSTLLGVALFATYSQSSFVSLLAALAAVAALRWSLRLVVGGLGILAVAVLLFGAFAGGTIKLNLGALNQQTSGRANLVEGGIDLFENRPLFGYGAGSFPSAFKREVAGADAKVVESHTEPVTVAAEQGVVGLAIYIALIATALAALTSGFRKVMPGLGAESGAIDPARGPPVARAAVFACFIAVLVHTLTYAGFLDDPVTWVLLAIGYSLAFPGRETTGTGRVE